MVAKISVTKVYEKGFSIIVLIPQRAMCSQ